MEKNGRVIVRVLKWTTIMKTNRRSIYKRYIRCPSCERLMVLWSRDSRKRKVGHIKTMYCYYCGKFIDGVEEYEFNQAKG